VDLSKGKLTKELIGKIKKIKELWEEKDRYKEMEKYHMEMGDYGESGTVINVQFPSPAHIVDANNISSTLRHYNRSVSNEFIQKNIDSWKMVIPLRSLEES